MKKLCNVIMLFTKKAGVISQSGYNGKLELGPSNVNDWQNLHLYLTSDEEIKERDWFIDIDNSINQAKDWKYPNCEKIIATTDKSLIINSKEFLWPSKLPQIPKSFIKAYIEAQGNIKEVLVECELDAQLAYTQIEDELIYKLKLRNDNTCIIHQAKTYTLEQLKRYGEYQFKRGYQSKSDKYLLSDYYNFNDNNYLENL